MTRVSVFAVNRYLRRLRLGCSAGPDGIRPEHLKYAMDDSFTLQLSILLSLCVAGGVVPDGFCVGTLISVLKKSNIDPQNPKNYRPITVTLVLSKFLELYILEQCTFITSRLYLRTFCDIRLDTEHTKVTEGHQMNLVLTISMHNNYL